MAQDTPDPQSPLFDSLYLFKDMMDFDRPTNWWAEERVGPNRFVVIDLIVNSLSDVAALEALPGAAQRVRILRLLSIDGLDILDDQEPPQPLYPDLTPSLLGVRTVFDIEGNPTGTTPMLFSQHPQWLGWKRV